MFVDLFTVLDTSAVDFCGTVCQFAVDDYVGVQRVRAFVLRHVETTPSTPTSTHNRTRQVWWMTLGSSYMTCILFSLSLNAMLGLVRKYNIYLTTLYFSLSLFECNGLIHAHGVSRCRPPGIGGCGRCWSFI